MSQVLVLVDHVDGSVRKTTTELLTIAKRLGEPAAVFIGNGFDNAAVSSADARGVMQILPSTWDYIQENLAGSTLDPASAYDNVHAGVMFLGDLLAQTGGDEATAAASYYQGPASVQTDGLLPETQDYVDNVMALRSQYGGP